MSLQARNAYIVYKVKISPHYFWLLRIFVEISPLHVSAAACIWAQLDAESGWSAGL